MVPGGVTEIIWHFAGYMHLADEVAQARLLYEGSPYHVRIDDYEARLPTYDAGSDLDSFRALGQRPPSLSMPELPDRDFVVDLDTSVFDPRVPTTAPALLAPALPHFGTGFGPTGSAIGASGPHRLDYEAGGDAVFQAKQWIIVNDDDRLGDVDDGGLHAARVGAAEEARDGLIAAVDDALPDAFDLPVVTGYPTAEFVKTLLATEDPAGGEGMAMAPGRYVDGVLSEEIDPPAEPVEDDEAPAPTSAGPGDPVAQDVALGGNTAENIAAIVDGNEGARTMVVMGDVWSMDAIIQINAYLDDDELASWAESQDPTADTATQAENIATYSTTELTNALSEFVQPGLRVTVDVVDGDFLDVKMLMQTNWISDNDIMAQSGRFNAFQAVLGENAQINAAQITDWLGAYDAIVIGGNLYQTNLIIQSNIIVDNDWLGGEGGAGNYLTGDNLLTNEASIDRYGAPITMDIPRSIDRFVDELEDGAEELDTLPWQMAGGASGAFNILYVTGDYYDINIIVQKNVITDADTYLAGPAPEGEGPETTLTVETGANAASNVATIVDVGPLAAQFVGGDHYADSLLVQLDIVTDDDDLMTDNPQALVGEVIAFFDDDDPPDDDGPLPGTCPSHAMHDFMGGILT